MVVSDARLPEGDPWNDCHVLLFQCERVLLNRSRERELAFVFICRVDLRNRVPAHFEWLKTMTE